MVEVDPWRHLAPEEWNRRALGTTGVGPFRPEPPTEPVSGDGTSYTTGIGRMRGPAGECPAPASRMAPAARPAWTARADKDGLRPGRGRAPDSTSRSNTMDLPLWGRVQCGTEA
jgi:hypothetical protein